MRTAIKRVGLGASCAALLFIGDGSARAEGKATEAGKQVDKNVNKLAKGTEKGVKHVDKEARKTANETGKELDRAGKDETGIVAMLRAIAGSAGMRSEQKNRRLWFGLSASNHDGT